MHETGDEVRLSISSYQQKQWTTLIDGENMSHTANKRETCNMTHIQNPGPASHLTAPQRGWYVACMARG